jgi:hypothetical protein
MNSHPVIRNHDEGSWMKSASGDATLRGRLGGGPGGRARWIEDVLSTATGCRVITKFPAKELLVCSGTYACGADAVDLEDARRVG